MYLMQLQSREIEGPLNVKIIDQIIFEHGFSTLPITERNYLVLYSSKGPEWR